MNAFLRWVRPILVTILILTPVTLGLVWRHQTDERRAKLDNVCTVLKQTHDDFQKLKTYVGLFLTDQAGRHFVAGLPVPPDPDC